MSVSATARSRGGLPAAPPRRTPGQNLSRFVRTPKGTLLLILLGLVVAALFHVSRHTLPTVGAALFGAVAVDLVASLARSGRWAFPSGSILSGLIVALVLARETPAYAVALTAGVAVASKYVLRTRWSNVFNPATLGVLVGDVLFRSGQSWWGTLPYDGLLGFVLVLAAAWYIASKVNKLPLALTFLGVSLAILTAASFLGEAARVAQIFRAPDINALVFFAGIMLTDPPTSPARQGDQVWFGALAGVVAAVIFVLLGVQWFILAGLPLANLAESLRRVAARPRTAGRQAQPATATRDAVATSARAQTPAAAPARAGQGAAASRQSPSNPPSRSGSAPREGRSAAASRQNSSNPPSRSGTTARAGQGAPRPAAGAQPPARRA